MRLILIVFSAFVFVSCVRFGANRDIDQYFGIWHYDKEQFIDYHYRQGVREDYISKIVSFDYPTIIITKEYYLSLNENLGVYNLEKFELIDKHKLQNVSQLIGKDFVAIRRVTDSTLADLFDESENITSWGYDPSTRVLLFDRINGVKYLFIYSLVTDRTGNYISIGKLPRAVLLPGRRSPSGVPGSALDFGVNNTTQESEPDAVDGTEGDKTTE